LRLLSYNIRFGGDGREDAIASVVNACEPDLVVLQEATRPDVVERLARATGMRSWGAHPGRSVGYMSRVPVADHRWHKTPPTRRSFLEVELPGTEFRVFGVHLTAVHSNWTERIRVRELTALLAGIRRHQHGGHVVLGDFNTLAPGAQLDVARLPPRLQAVVWLTGRKIRWRTIQLMLDAAYVDVYRSLHPAEPGLTFPTWAPQMRLDYAFVPAAWRARVQGCMPVDTPDVKAASDHLPLLVELAPDGGA
jgi:exodeoxyribonuclease-3